MQFFSNPKDEMEAAALAASMRAIKICQESAHLFPLEAVDHKRWCEDRVREPWVVKVSEPESRGTYLKKHMTYLVTETHNKYNARRRFSDFEWLHAVLRARYIGMLIPSLPEKTMMIQTETSVVSRMRGLTLFLQHVVASPYLREDPAVVGFLSKDDEKEWEFAKKDTAIMENGGPGQRHWIKRVVTQQIPPNADHEIMAFRRQIEQQEKLVAELATSTKRLADKSLAMSKEVGALCSLLSGWSVAETTSSEHNPDLLVTLAQTRDVINGWSDTIRYEPGILELTLHESLKYLSHQYRDMKEMLGHRSAAQQATLQPVATATTATTTSTASSVVNAASNLASRFRSSSDSPPITTEQTIQRSKQAFDLATKALVAEEMGRFRNQKKKALEDAINHFAFAQSHLSKRASTLWRDYIKANVADSQALRESTKQILENNNAGVAEQLPPGSAQAY